MARTTYALLDPEVLARNAQILGSQSSAARALSDAVDRARAGQTPVILSASCRGSTSTLVVDAGNLPDFLPKGVCDAIRQALGLTDDVDRLDGDAEESPCP